jgi:hypothetical protein
MNSLHLKTSQKNYIQKELHEIKSLSQISKTCTSNLDWWSKYYSSIDKPNKKDKQLKSNRVSLTDDKALNDLLPLNEIMPKTSLTKKNVKKSLKFLRKRLSHNKKYKKNLNMVKIKYE